MSRWYRPFYRDDSKSGHTDFHTIRKALAKKNKDKPKFCEYHKIKTHDTNEYSAKEGGWRKRPRKRAEIFSITGPHLCTNRQSRYPDARPYHQNVLNITFSMNDPRPEHWDPDDPLHIAGFVSRHHVEQVYIDNRSRVNVITSTALANCPSNGKRTVRLPFILVSHDEEKEITRVLDFSVVNCPAEHNILLGRPALFQLRAIPSTIHGVITFSEDTEKPLCV
uniref:Uncharacterized protein n=1 Tax=Lactuca sativa TaxID=4236 RepID=A0A9R1X9H7_LACSA|nr:hypothetical protein LSAT_V11C600313880 [Lactuca sativa]